MSYKSKTQMAKKRTFLQEDDGGITEKEAICSLGCHYDKAGITDCFVPRNDGALISIEPFDHFIVDDLEDHIWF